MLREQCDYYIMHMNEVRQLSSPRVETSADGSSYGKVLAQNFKRIGELADINRHMLKEDLYPLIESNQLLMEETVRILVSFCQRLIDASDVESLDAPLVALITNRLLSDALEKDDADYAVEQLDTQIVACYSLMSMSMRITCSPQIAQAFRSKGLEAAERLQALLDPQAFDGLSMLSRELVLTNARYATVLFEATTPTPELNERELSLLDRAMALARDPYYREAVSDFDWEYYQLRTLEYAAMSTDIGNVRAFDHGQLGRIARYTERLCELWHSSPERYEAFVSREELAIVSARNRYLVGDLSRAAYQDALLDVYHKRDTTSFSSADCYASLLAPLEYLISLDPQGLTNSQQDVLRAMYEDICRYAVGVAKHNSLGFVLEYFSLILEHFIEVPGGITFEDMGLRCLAALHPPTYVHSIMVGELTRCLTRHLVHLRSELFVGVLGCADEHEVQAREQRIVSFAHHAARCHDFGKLPLIDTIFVYGRDLLDFEFGLVREHPQMGARMLARHESTRAYADIALRHHLWYDQQRGYPLDAAGSCALQTIVDVVTCADCMDAATDPVGRSYRKGKQLDVYLDEVREGAGTRYAPYLPALLARPEVRAELDQLLTTGREQNYHKAYQLLHEVQETH